MRFLRMKVYEKTKVPFTPWGWIRKRGENSNLGAHNLMRKKGRRLYRQEGVIRSTISGRCRIPTTLSKIQAIRQATNREEKEKRIGEIDEHSLTAAFRNVWKGKLNAHGEMGRRGGTTYYFWRVSAIVPVVSCKQQNYYVGNHLNWSRESVAT